MVGNLGSYQLMTVAAKKVGGPYVLASLMIGGSLLSGILIGGLLSKWSNKKYLKDDDEDIIDLTE